MLNRHGFSLGKMLGTLLNYQRRNLYAHPSGPFVTPILTVARMLFHERVDGMRTDNITVVTSVSMPVRLILFEELTSC